MKEHIAAYIKEINRLYQTGLTTEHSFRPALKQLLEDCTGFTVINEQSHIDCGAPDLTLLKKDLPVAYVEAKDLEDGDLDGRKKNREQFDRYKASLDTILFTDYLDFHLYEHGEWVQSVRLCEVQGNKIRLSDEDRFISLMEHLKMAQAQRITSAAKLAQIMAGKARLLRDVIETALLQDGDTETELRGYMEAFRQVLIHDITPKTFADIYAQTIAYGMFAARLHDQTPEDFTRSEAANLIPKSNPFLRKVFQQIAGYDLDDRIAWIVDDLVSAFAATDMEHIMQGFGKSTQQTDPMLHFYEDFLFQYDPAAKKQCGVYYTPQPVVSFIVRAVDDILRTEFRLPMGLADTSKVEVEQAIPQDLKHRTEAKFKHRVQVLDPATGTGTFLAETVRQIKRDLGGQMGAWPSYVPEHLLPRLHGFELMMAPYTIAHLKLDMEIGIPSRDRFNVYLTNSLEEYNEDAGTLFGNYLAQEANAASAIKRDAPVMIVLGNPPYSGESQNKGKWIMSLMEDYKKEPGGKQPLDERNSKWLNDDYVKFIRLAQHYIEKKGEGIIGFINPHGFLDNPTFRGMRWNLLKTFDKIYTIDLHGNSKKKETCPDGSKDENVFDIMQGVSINLFVKTGKKDKDELGKVYHKDLYGLREDKYDFLDGASIENVGYQEVQPQNPMYFFVPKNYGLEGEYKTGFKVDELFKVCMLGPNSHRDDFAIAFTNEEALVRLSEFANKSISDSDIENKYHLKETGDWKIREARQQAKEGDTPVKCIYRAFDFRYMLYYNYIFDRPRHNLNDHLIKNNLGLIVNRQSRLLVAPFVTDLPLGQHCIIDPREGSYAIPLYLYDSNLGQNERIVNFNKELYDKIAKGLNYLPSYDDNELIDPTSEYNGVLYPQDLFDYIYAVLHSPSYRERYKEFLKIDFPRIPYPTDWEKFRDLAMLGEELRELHLMHDVPASTVTFPEAGSMLVDKITYNDGRVYINGEQYFDNVPLTAWEFYIGGYQPAQKWLKDRKGRTLSFDDIEHYRQIIAILIETDKLMKEIDK